MSYGRIKKLTEMVR